MKEIRKEVEVSWYDEEYLKYDEEYLKYIYSKEYWCYNFWKTIIDSVGQKEKIGDFGCGTGILAYISKRNKKTYKRGIDYSKVAIDIAKQLNPTSNFVVGNILDKSTYDFDYDIAIFSEVLEHIDDDLEVISLVEKKKRIILSVPNYDYESHVRFFENEKDVCNRYEELIDIEKILTIVISPIKKVFILVGYKR